MSSKQLQSKDDIIKWLQEEEIDSSYFIHEDLSVTFYEHAYFNNIDMQILPLVIHSAEKGLTISGCGLESLKGCPKVVNGSFDCSINNLTSLEGCPEIIEGNFTCNYNDLQSLEYSPKKISGSIDYRRNKIKSLKGMRITQADSMSFNNNELTSLEGICQKIMTNLDISNNPITSLEHLGFIGKSLYCYDTPLTSLKGLSQRNIAIYHKHSTCIIEELQEFYYEQNGTYVLQMDLEKMQTYLEKEKIRSLIQEPPSHQIEKNYKL